MEVARRSHWRLLSGGRSQDVVPRPGIQVGQNTLFRWLGKHGWLYRRAGDWHPYQDKVDAGLVTLKTNRPYWDAKRGVDVLPSPTIRITAKGVQKLYTALGGDMEAAS